MTNTEGDPWPVRPNPLSVSEIRALQIEMTQWLEHNFGGETDNKLASTMGLVEEVGELGEAVMGLALHIARLNRAVLKQYQGIRGTYDEWQAAIETETADSFVKLVDIARVCGFDLSTVVWGRWDQLKMRDWKKDPAGGGVGHGMPEGVSDGLGKAPNGA